MKSLVSSRTGGAQQHINKNDIENMKFVLPHKEVMCSFNNVVQTVLDKTGIICLENNKLSSIRDALLPKLMSGEIEVK